LVTGNGGGLRNGRALKSANSLKRVNSLIIVNNIRNVSRLISVNCLTQPGLAVRLSPESHVVYHVKTIRRHD
ncbi:hypothetical protein, partial [Yersinia pestis]